MASKFFVKFVKTPSHKRFEYTPRYYNPEKEAREQRKADRIQRKNAGSTRLVQPGSFSTLKKKKDNTSSIRLILILLLILLVLGYFLLGKIALYISLGILLGGVFLLLKMKQKG